MHPPSPCPRQAAEAPRRLAKGQTNGPGARPWLKSSSIFNQAAAARKGLGLCVLPHLIPSNHPDLRMVLPGEVRLERTCWLTCHRDLRPIPRERAVIAFMAETLPKHAGTLNWPAPGAAG